MCKSRIIAVFVLGLVLVLSGLVLAARHGRESSGIGSEELILDAVPLAAPEAGVRNPTPRQGPTDPIAREEPVPGVVDAVETLRKQAADAPAATAAWAVTLPAGSWRGQVLEQVALVWAGQDASAALAWACGLALGEERDRLLRAVGYEAIRDSPSNAVAAALAMGNGTIRNPLLIQAAGEWALQDPPAALDWVQTVREGGLRDALFSELAIAWAKLDGQQAAKVASQCIRSGDEGRRTLVAVVQRWAGRDPEAARHWVWSLQDPDLEAACSEAVATNIFPVVLKDPSSG